MKKLCCFAIIIICISVILNYHFNTKKSITLNKWNSNVNNNLREIKKKSILYYDGKIFYNDKSFYNFTQQQILPLKYEMAQYDADLMPMIISDNIIICQNHTLKILNNNSFFEYNCNDQIIRITFPKEINDTLYFYIIKFNSNKRISLIPEEERKWIIQKLTFNGKIFIEETICVLNIPKSYTINRKKTEVSFFEFYNGFFDIVLSDKDGVLSIFKFDTTGKMIRKESNGSIIIPNRFSDKKLWYIEEEQGRPFLKTEQKKICEVNKFITQGVFIDDDIIEFIIFDTSEFGTINYYPKYTSFLYSIDKNEIINTYYKNEKNKDNILVIY